MAEQNNSGVKQIKPALELLRVLVEVPADKLLLESGVGDGRAFVWMDVYLAADVLKVLEGKNAKIAELTATLNRLRNMYGWHRQSEEDIYFDAGKHWGSHYAVIFKNGSLRFASGGCDEGGDGSVSTFLYILGADGDIDDDLEWDYDDIDLWMEIPWKDKDLQGMVIAMNAQLGDVCLAKTRALYNLRIAYAAECALNLDDKHKEFFVRSHDYWEQKLLEISHL